MPISLSLSVGPAQNSPSSERDELQAIEDHRPWEMLDNVVLAIIDQTYAALHEILGLLPPPPEGGRYVTASQLIDASDPDSPLLCVEATATHCRIHVQPKTSHGGRRGFAEHAAARRKISSSPPPGQAGLTRARVHAAPGTLYLARVDGGGRGDYADDDARRPDVSVKGVMNAIHRRLDAAVQAEASLLRTARAHRYVAPKTKEIFRVWMELQSMRREVIPHIILRRWRYQRQMPRRRQVGLIAGPPPAAEMDDVNREDDAEALTERLKALQMDVDREDEADVLTKRLKTLHV